MARKNTHAHKMLDSVSMGTSQTSAATNVLNMDKASLFVEWSAGSTPIGTITIEARNKSDGNWYELSFGSSIDVSGNSGSHQIYFTELPFVDIRVKYNRTSGSGTLNATLVIKQVGG